MSYLVFARKWRPLDFDEIVGQGHVATTLKNAIKLNRVGQAYLFAGPRGVGKTSTARILAKALNCETGPTPSPCNKCANCLEISAANSLDVIEIDGASNRGIDEIRQLRENAKLSTARGRFKIYIIDEVHQITEAAFNALLKTLEEPPSHVKFIFATTQPHKIPATILSRCQRFDFRRIPQAEIVAKLKEISEKEKIDAQEGVFFEIARASEGSLRDAESILDQLNSFCEKKIEINHVTKVLGLIEDEILWELAEFAADRDASGALKKIDDLTNEGRDLFQFLARFIEHIRNLTVIKINKNLKSTLALPDETFEKLARQSERLTLEELIYAFYLLSNTYETAKRTALVRFSLEFAIIKIARRSGIMPIDELLKKLEGLKGGCAVSDHGPGKEKAVQKEDPVPPPASSAATDTNASWTELLKRLSKKRVSLASFLMEGEPDGVENGLMKVNFPKMHKFHKEILEKPENKKIIEELIKEIFGEALKVEFKLVEKIERRNNFKLEDDAPKKEDDPLLKDALNIFNGSVVRNNRFDTDV
ncbi:MAG: DNA polymerase III subunit gamma/tau [Candidatus Omnitrophica bacterium]|nr:DNA polymerase III subunit gamma/tau [Candidatus Omnitrophota bacterium]